MNTFLSRLLAFATVASAVALAAPAFAQNSLTVTPETTAYSTDGGTVTFDVAIAYTGTPATAVTFAATAPTGWSFTSAAGTNVPDVVPTAGDQGQLGFLYVTIPSNAAHFTFTLTYPAGLTGNQTVTAIVSSLRPGPVTLTASDVSIGLAPYVPRISTQPQGSTVDAGQTLNFSVTANGSPAPTYQWMKNGAAIAGANSSTLTITNAQLADAGSYTVTVTNSAGTLTSAAAVAVVQAAPVITTQPADTLVVQGTTGTLTVAATGYPAPTYQWSFNGSAITGATTASLALTNAQTTAAGNYAVTITNTKGTATSRTAVVTVTIPPTITTQPVPVSIFDGGRATYSVAATGTQPLSYQWYKNGAPITGATTATYSIAAAHLVDAGNYNVVVTNSGGSVSSNSVRLDVSFTSTLTPTFTATPSDQAIVIGNSTTLTASAVATGPVSYQWYKNGAPIAGATSATFTLSSAQASDAGSYAVKAWASGSATITSNFAVAVGTAPAVTTAPAPQTLRGGDTISLSVVATGTAPLGYQWSLNGTPVSGATSSTFTLKSAQPANAGNYTVAVSNAFGSATGGPAAVTIDYSGAYFGTLGASQGTWALYLTPQRTGTFIAYLSGTKTALVQPVTVNADGSFNAAVTFDQPEPTSSVFSAGGTGPTTPTILASSGVLSGQISGSQFAGQISGVNLTITGALDTATGTVSAATGYYTGGATNTGSGKLYCVVGPSGKDIVLLVNGTSADLATGTVDTSGKLNANTTNGNVLALTVDGGAQNVSGTVAGSAGTTSYYAAPLTASSRLVNLSASALVGPNNMTLGFVIKGGTKSMLIRGAGPSLSLYGVASPLPKPVLTLFGPSGVMATNTAWGGSVTLSQLFASIGAFPFPTWTSDTALSRSLGSALYSAQITGAAGSTGTALAEVYDADGTNYTGRLVNASVLCTISNTGGVIGGFAISGNAPERVLIRAAGPALAGYGVPSPLAAPSLTVYDANGKVIATNTAWGGSTALSDIFTAVGAFPFAAASNDTAVVMTLAPGSYTAQVGTVTGTTGTALLEIYEVP